jgi:NAD+ diphosphatase
MFQDIAPHRLSIAYTPKKPQVGDYLIFIQDNKVLMVNDGMSVLPQYGIEPFKNIDDNNPMQFLLSVDEISFFFFFNDHEIYEKTMLHQISILRTMEPMWIGFAAATAFHLATWYDNHRYCGHCKTPLKHLTTERALRCPVCNVKEYPKISPVVIVGITDGDRLLLTKYATGEYQRYALVAGYVEIGETLEDAVRREVMEEVGLEVHNMHYYKSQPWGFSESVLAGFFAETDNSQALSIDSRELAEAVWFHRDALPSDDTTLSLTWEMIDAFKRGWRHK